MSGVNWFLIIVVVVVALLTVPLSLYLLIMYQHPDDSNQAWAPKFVVLLGLCVAIWMVLMFPLDVANSQSCSLSSPLANCTLTFPMTQLWEALYITSIVLLFLLIPFMALYYEGDSDKPVIKRIVSAAMWTGVIVIFILLIIGLPYAFAGYAFYPTQAATSGLLPVSALSNASTTLNSCIGISGPLLSNISGPPSSVTSTLCNAALNGSSQSWKVRVSVIVYAMAIIATVGWFLFLLFGSIGLVTFPIDMILGFVHRPKTTISRVQYVERAKDLARRANDIKQIADDLQKQRRIHGATRKWRRNFAALQYQVTLLEEDQAQLETVYPQGEDPAYSWTVTIILQWVKLFLGIVSLVISILWVLQIILYVVVQPPATPFLNNMFVSANNVFPLFGTLLFGIFAFYLQAAVIKGNFQFGINLLIFRIYPIRMGATMMSSFLFNVALILIATTACIQFSADAFALYAADTSIMDIYGNILGNLQGLSVLYTKNVFIYVFLGLIGLTTLVVIFRGLRPRKKRNPRQMKYTM